MSLDQELAARFVCAKCQARGARVKRVALAGTGISRLLNIQHNKYAAASCNRCGFTEFYNAEILEDHDTGMDVLDFLFGG